jgi:hypothetical protein
MTWMRSTKRWTWAVAAWWALSLLVANAAPLMTPGGALVCSASGTRWVEPSAKGASAATNQVNSTSHTWHCSLCLPFVAVSLPPPLWVASSTPRVAPSEAFARARVADAPVPYGARAPPCPLNA